MDEATVGEALAMMTQTAEGLRPNNSTQVTQPSVHMTSLASRPPDAVV